MRLNPFISFLMMVFLSCVVFSTASLIILEMIFLDVQIVSWGVGVATGMCAVCAAGFLWLYRELF